MELTIKELAAYLPYGLKIQNGWGDIKTLRYTHLDDEGNGFIANVRPILYPLDYLTKEITHNGKTFVPIEILFEIKYLEHSAKGRNYYIEVVPNWVLCSGNWTATSFKFNLSSVDNNYYWAVQKLLEWKFDIFNLIENKLAIAVTEDFNPYK